MRKIIFRGKSPTDGKWHKGDIITDNGCGYPRIKDCCKDGYPEFIVNSDSVGQFIGTCDVSGTEIFEGDIVMHKAFGMCYIGFVHQEMGYCLITADGDLPISGLYERHQWFDVSVIGNMYENLDMIKDSWKSLSENDSDAKTKSLYFIVKDESVFYQGNDMSSVMWGWVDNPKYATVFGTRIEAELITFERGMRGKPGIRIIEKTVVF